MDLLKMHATTLLRHTTYVETAAPVWSASFWKEYVAPHLKNVDRGVCTWLLILPEVYLLRTACGTGISASVTVTAGYH